jgi:alpha-ketoglutarate-dependent taurine dioxygenase
MLSRVPSLLPLAASLRRCFSASASLEVGIPEPGVVSVRFPALPRPALFHGIWLRDHCPASHHPLTGQRTVSVQGLPLTLSPTRAFCEGGASVCLEWPCGHRSTFSAAWLQRYAYWWAGDSSSPGQPQQQALPLPAGAPLTASAWWRDAASDTSSRSVWQAASFPTPAALPSVPYAAFMEEGAGGGGGAPGLARALRLLRDFGFVLIQGCPATEAATEAACLRIGFLRPTLYGPGMWRTEVRPDPARVSDTAYTALPLPLHSDGNYLGEPPGLQVFHCTQPDASGGGDSLLLDGLALAARLAAAHPQAYRLLTIWPFPYHHTGRDGLVRAARPVFALDASGQAAGVHLNECDRGPVTVPPSWGRELALAQALAGGSAAGQGLAVDPTLASPATAIPAMYAALQALGEGLADPALTLRLPLRPGTLLVFNNHRVLHGRAEFNVASGRTLVGCYIGKDEWESKLREEEERESPKK